MNAIHTPDPSIKLLEGFLSHFATEAVAHAREELTEEQKTALAAFAKGELDEAARKELIPLLAHNTTALEHLAGLLKNPKSGSGNSEN